ncbi:response regulator transcription factor [Roseovarius sp. E0-M6]|uniref:response regulator transcription factor n=1 Tax=Roseovarius sp. E0-M6 TaxID=3127118 RepID=UPI00300F9542
MAAKVLLIEDEPNIIEAIGFVLKRDGLNVRTHSNGVDAIEAVRRESPDLVILDVMLPGRSGYEILEELRDDAQIGDIPVLMLTARGQARDREMAERAGASRYMTKPFANAAVLEAVRELLGQ